MPSRIIREGLLDSEHYWSVSIEARQLFVHLMLLADDFGLVSLAPVFLRRRCFDNLPPDLKVSKQIAELHDEDLLRVYEVNGARFGFIPRFGQRMRQWRARHPMPPESLFSEDPVAKSLFIENRHLFQKLSAGRRQAADNLRPEVEVKGREKEVEVKAAKGKGNGEGDAPADVTATPKGAQQEGPVKSVREWAEELGLKQENGEHEGAFQVRVAAAVTSHKTKTPT